MTQYLYDEGGRLTVTIDADSKRTTQFYDAAGNMTGVKDARSNLTQYVYDALNRATVTVDGENNRTTQLFDVAGRQTGMIDGRGGLTQYHLDALGRATITTGADNRYVYRGFDANGNVLSVADDYGNLTEYLYDALNRQTVTLDPRGTYRTTLLYDAAGNLTSHRDAQNNVTTFAYDALNRKIRETDPLGKHATFAYNAVGLLTSATDRLGRRRDFQYDAANRLTTETWLTSGTAVETILYSYDAVGNRLTAQNSVGTYTMTYDAVNRATVAKGLWGVTLTMAYDAVGNRTQVEDSSGGVVTSTYDNANRLTQRKLDAGTPEIRVDQTYNKTNQIETQTRWSDLSGTTKVGSTTYTYDAVARVTAMDHRNGSGTLLATYLYSYDNAGRLSSESINGTSKGFYHDAADQLYIDGASSWSYDGTGNRTNSGYSTGTGNRLSTDGTWTFTYDDEGNLTKKTKGLYQETWYYGYDHRNQMTSADKRSADDGQPSSLQLTADYRYDAHGNRVEKVVDSDGNGAGGSTTERYALDGWKTGPQKSFVGLENWDVWADLDGSNALQVRYLRGDVIDQLFARIASGSAKWELVDRLGSVLAETDSAGAVASNISYDAWGNVASGSLPGRYQWTGRERDAETGYQYNRGRYLDTLVSRWTSTDPLGFDAGDSNLYRYVKNQPVSATDPSGLLEWDNVEGPLFVQEKDLFRAKWAINFRTTGKEDGYIIQEITQEVELYQANDKTPLVISRPGWTQPYTTPHPFTLNRLRYYELWEVTIDDRGRETIWSGLKKDNLTRANTVNKADDTLYLTIWQDDDPPINGWRRTSAVAQFYKKKELDAATLATFKREGIAEANGLNHRLTPPPDWGRPRDKVERTFLVTWAQQEVTFHFNPNNLDGGQKVVYPERLPEMRYSGRSQTKNWAGVAQAIRK